MLIVCIKVVKCPPYVPSCDVIIFTHYHILKLHLSGIYFNTNIVMFASIFISSCFFICRLYFLSSPLTCRFPPPWPVLVVQNQQNVCFPSKGWLSLHTGSISQEILRRPSATACSCGGRSLIILECYCCCPPFTSSAEDLTGENTLYRLANESSRMEGLYK